MKITETEDKTTAGYPALVEDSDSDSDDEHSKISNAKAELDVLPEDSVDQYGNDVVIENDPVEMNSNRKIRKHKAKIPPPQEIESEHFVVEKVINHKGSSARPSSMQLYVKWHGYDNSENSWISWRDNNELAAVDTYLANNPEIVPPVFNERKRPVFRKKLVTHVKRTTKLQPKGLSESETYTVNYLPPKCVSASEMK